MTGRELLNQQHGIALRDIVTGGAADVFDWWRGKIVLTNQTAAGTTPRAHLYALHELAHWRQYEERPWIFWLLWLRPVRWWLEADAWRRALALWR